MIAIGLSLKGRYILLDDNTTLPIVEMLDKRGETTTDPELAVGVIYQRPDDRFGVEYVETFREADLMIDAIN